MKIKWLGHACFLITSDEGVRIITDPYEVGGGINYGKVDEAADVVTVSHQHGDHSNASAVRGKPVVVDVPGVRTVKGIDFKGIGSYHDEAKGGQRGENIIFCFTLDGMRVCHLGDLGHPLEGSTASEIGAVDILLVPVGGFFTIDAAVAAKVCEALGPRVIIPMHFKTAKCDYPIAGVDDFLRGKQNVRRLEESEAGFSKDRLPSAAEIVVLKHAL